jgi:REP element-mobilizing transposase RayT
MVYEKRPPHRSALRKGRVSLPNYAYFLTKRVAAPDLAVLAQPETAGAIISTLEWISDQDWVYIGGFVIMPDHYHCVLGLTGKRSLQKVMESVGRFTARRINIQLQRKGSFWEEGFYDHAIRQREDFDDIFQYMHENPVRKELCEYPDDWSYSTAHPNYAGCIDWEWFGPSSR